MKEGGKPICSSPATDGWCATGHKAMRGLKAKIYKPNPKVHAVYKKLYLLYKKLHDAFGANEWNGNLYDVMKKLIEIRNAARSK
jgi:L-ribulokinase